MNEDGLSPGWYAEPGGARRYWDGSRWLVPAADQADQESDIAERHGRRRRAWTSLAVAAVLIALGIGTALIVTAGNADRERREAEAVAAEEAEAQAAAEAEREAEAEAAERRAQLDAEAARERAELERTLREGLDESMRSSGEGWEVVSSGDLYFRFARDDEFSCGYWDCVGVVVLSMSGCPGGVYVEAAIESNGVVVGQANAIIGSLQAEQVGAEVLEDLTNTGGTFRVATVQCM